MKKLNRKGLELEMLGKAIITIGVIVLIILIIVIFSGKGNTALEYLKNLLRFK